MRSRAPELLIIDAEEAICELLAALARRVGFKVFTASTAPQGLWHISRCAADVVVLDLALPASEGRRLLQRIRQLPSMLDRAVVAVTHDSSREVRLSALRAGADQVLLKPVDPEEFMVHLRALARRWEQHGELAAMRRERDRAMRSLQQRTEELERLTSGLVTALERANVLNDMDTGSHLRRVCGYAQVLAHAQGSGPKLVRDMGRYAGLHDVGKVGIRDAILKKPGPLTAAEFEEMKGHTFIGAELIRAAGLPDDVADMAMYHHERWDGGGYPEGLSGDQIPLSARLVAVVDVFDALTNRRCYKDAFSLKHARGLMQASSGEHLDPNLVGLFFGHIDAITEVARKHPDPDMIPWW